MCGLLFLNGLFNEGDVLYLSDIIVGVFIKIELDILVEIGYVVRIGNNNGELFVVI